MPDSDFIAMRSIAAKVWAVLLAIVAIILIATAWMAFAAFNTAHSTADCAMADQAATHPSHESSSHSRPTRWATTRSRPSFPAFCAALLFIVAAVHILLPKPPNPGCSKCTAGLANTIALTGVIVYISFAIFEGAAHSTWATDQAANYTSACDATTSPEERRPSRAAASRSSTRPPGAVGPRLVRLSIHPRRRSGRRPPPRHSAQGKEGSRRLRPWRRPSLRASAWARPAFSSI